MAQRVWRDFRNRIRAVDAVILGISSARCDNRMQCGPVNHWAYADGGTTSCGLFLQLPAPKLCQFRTETVIHRADGRAEHSWPHNSSVIVLTFALTGFGCTSVPPLATQEEKVSNSADVDARRKRPRPGSGTERYPRF